MTQPTAAVVGLWHETNTYSSRRATMLSFGELELLEGADVVARHAGTNSIIGGFLQGPFAVEPIFSARAWPSGPADALTADGLLDRLRGRAHSAPEVDAVLLAMHGAMVCDGYDDIECDVLTIVRDRWPQADIGVVLDLHANPSAALFEHSDVVLGFKTYPHEDMAEQGLRLARLLDDHRRERRTTSFTQLPLLSSPLAQATAEQPMCRLLEEAQSLAHDAGMDDVTLLPGFAYADIARAGFTIAVTGPADRQAAAARLLEHLRRSVQSSAAAFVVTRPGPREAVSRAVASQRRPVALVDVADNIGGGGAGDGTALLAELLAQQVQDAIVTIADPVAAVAAHRAGPGGTFHSDVGGRTDDLHGPPVDVQGEVVAVADGEYTASGTWLTGQRFNTGQTAVVRCREGVLLVLTERAVPPFHKEQITRLGLEPHRASAITFKGAVAWRADYADVIGEIIEVDTPGACPLDPMALPRLHRPTA